MRIAFVTQWFTPESGTIVPSAIASGLASRGHHVDVLTGFPNYPSGRLHSRYPLRPYRRERQTEMLEIHRAPLYPSHDRSTVRRVANYASFAAAATLVARAKLPRPDAWLVYSSPATAAFPALLGQRRHPHAPIYLMIQDLWPDSVLESGFVPGPVGKVVARSLTRYCSWTYRRAEGIGVISPGMAQVLVSRGVPAHRVHYTPNWVDDSLVTPSPAMRPPDLRPSLGLPEGRLFMYAGNMGEFQGLSALVHAFGECPGSQLVMVGEGVAKRRLMALAQSLHLSNVSFRDQQAPDRVGQFISASDIQIVSLRDTPLMRVTMPSKLQTSLAAGRPILAHAAGDVADIVTRSGAGVIALPGDRAGTLNAIRALQNRSSAELETMGRRARKYCLEHFSQAAGLDRLEAMILGQPPGRRDA